MSFSRHFPTIGQGVFRGHRKDHERSAQYNAKEYKGICSTTWKERYGNHRKAFRNDYYEKDFALSEEVWNIKRNDGQYTMQWQKHQDFPSYTPETMKCSLCMNEKL